MRVENREDQGGAGPRHCVRGMQPSSGMDGDVCQDAQHSRPMHKRRSSKNKAPLPPAVVHGPCVSSHAPAVTHTTMEQKENLLEQELLLTVVLPEGVEKTTMVHGSKPMIDLLVMLCAKYHLNPSSHTIELVSTNKNHIKFKPNALIGALEAEKVLLKPKGMEDKNRKTGPQMPEATVRLVINYKRTQKTILRVNPKLALQELLPAICEKCEFDVQSTVLLQNVHSQEPLDLNNSLNDFGLRELYARDTRVISPTDFPPSPTHSDGIQPGKDKLQKEKENKGLFGMFRRGSKKKPDQASTVSAPASPNNRKSRPVSMSSLGMHSPTYDSNTMPSDTPKKRRAPLPPHMKPSDLSHQHSNSQTSSHPDGNQVAASLSRSSSTESSLKRSKRKAPPPPASPSSPSVTHDEKTQDTTVTGLSTTPEEIQENQETSMVPDTPVVPVSSSPESLSPLPELLEDDSSVNLSADVSLDSGRAETASPTQDSEMESVAPPRESPQEVLPDLTTDGKLAADSEVKRNQPEADSDARLQSTNNANVDERTEKACVTAECSTAMKEECTAPIDAAQDSIHIVAHTQRAEPQAPPKPSYAAAAVQTTPNTSSTATSASQTHTEIQTEIYSSTEATPTPESVVCTSVPLGSPKRDIATSTEEPQTQEFHRTSTQSFDVQTSTYTHLPESPKSTQTPSSEDQKSTQVSSASKHGNLQYLVGSEPKPKPSNELTREYIPKVGMTTYTIVPPKSLDKLRFFEVELTLESPSVPGVQEVNVESLSQKSTAAPPPVAASPTRFECRSGSASDLSPSISPTVESPSDSSSIPQAKEKKVPPATRPKPSSFRLPQHKRTPGSYVSSAVRSMSLSEEKEPLGSPPWESFHGLMQENLPPPPPPVQWEEEMKTEEKHISPPTSPLKEEEMERSSPASSPRETDVFSGSAHSVLPRQMSLPTAGLTLEKLRSFAAPKPYSSSTPSRFAQAVSTAVKRSQSLTHNPVRLCSHKVPLAMTKRCPIRETDEFVELPTFRDVDSGHGQRKSSSDSYVSPVEENEEVWKRRTPDLSSDSGSNAHCI
ncbi:cordon-bleu protein-like 1b isoform X1 [Pangasianodon hypophthalmus]|uniref:cordon-bleu protein-like 1b isoform X1 n=4 Tax=Pangasianodon hypophthalmus TaxID=310915 RepID=UPI002307988E|nr:cordon-bleu protein-like 1b isoform X1 [Pangasianodon hypophthalmus]